MLFVYVYFWVAFILFLLFNAISEFVHSEFVIIKMQAYLLSVKSMIPIVFANSVVPWFQLNEKVE